MKKKLVWLLLTLFIFFSVCCTKKENRKDYTVNNNIVIEIIEKSIELGNLKRDISILPRLSYFNLYIPEFFSDGMEIPPPQIENAENISVKWFIERIDDSTLFSLEEDSTHVKEELAVSESLYSSFVLPDSISESFAPYFEDHNYYAFYVPIFNHDSSAVYIQYDYVNVAVGGGIGFLFEKNENIWILKKKIRTWYS